MDAGMSLKRSTSTLDQWTLDTTGKHELRVSTAPDAGCGDEGSLRSAGRMALCGVAPAGARRMPGSHAADSIVRTEVIGELALEMTAAWLSERQAADGHWRFPLEGDTILESETVLIMAWAGRLDQVFLAGCARRILAEQLPSGGWAIYPGGPIDPSATVKAYLALKIAGYPADAEPLVRARQAVAAAGGPWAVNSFTRFYLALLGQIPYAACPAVPPEMVLLPDWFPVNLYRVSAWSRTMIVPLSLIWAYQPVRPLPASLGIGELFVDADPTRPPRLGGDDAWAFFFRGVDRLLKAADRWGFRPLRSRAVAACRRWMLERFSHSDGLGAIYPPIVWSIVALRAMGCDEQAPEVVECWRQLFRLVEQLPDGAVRVEPCRSPVWDTAITVRGLADREAFRAAAHPTCDNGHARKQLAAAVDWLLDHEIRSGGDWSRRVAAEPSGWCFEYANRFYPDVDDTAMVLIATSRWREVLGDARDAKHVGRLGRLAAATSRARRWLEAMQNRDGGWGAFDRNNDCALLCKVPFADHNAMIDPSSPDLAGRVLEAFGRVGLRIGHTAVDRGCRYLRAHQESDGSWFGRWGVNYLYGTWQAIEGLRAVGIEAEDPAILAAVDWILSHQQPDGGWGESPDSYANAGMAGRGIATASQTAWAVAGLLAAGRVDQMAVRRGIQWLISRQRPDGDWNEEPFTGTGFPRVFYLRYHGYRVNFPLMAIARWLAAERSNRARPDVHGWAAAADLRGRSGQRAEVA